MSDDQYNAMEFGKVIATLEAQNKVLAKMQQDIGELFSTLRDIQQSEAKRCREKTSDGWGREIVAAILGAVAYFVFDYFLHGGK